MIAVVGFGEGGALGKGSVHGLTTMVATETWSSIAGVQRLPDRQRLGFEQ